MSGVSRMGEPEPKTWGLEEKMELQNREKNRSPRTRADDVHGRNAGGARDPRQSPEDSDTEWYRNSKRFVLPVERCPLCGAEGTFQIMGRMDDIPYFGETMETLMSCDNCKFKHADVICLDERTPMRYEFQIASKDDLLIRVVKSSTGMIKLPELGVTVEPGPASEGYVSNIEGVLDRVGGAIKIAIEGASAAKRKRGKGKLKKLEEVRSGKRMARLILMDPFGYSAIVDERAKKRRLTKRELTSLKTGLPT